MLYLDSRMQASYAVVVKSWLSISVTDGLLVSSSVVFHKKEKEAKRGMVWRKVGGAPVGPC